MAEPVHARIYGLVARQAYRLGTDFDHNGDVLFARAGCLFRLSGSEAQSGEIEGAGLVADLNGLTFEPRVATG